MQHNALHLIDKLIASWGEWDSNSNKEYYLTVLAPSIMRSDGSANLTDVEKKIKRDLRELLSSREWKQLPTLIAQRQAGELEELASDRERARAISEADRLKREERAKRKKEEERKRRKIERERVKQEQKRRQAEEASRERKRALISRLKERFELDFLSADKVFVSDPDAELVSTGEFDDLKTQFVQDWAAKELQLELDSEQAFSVASTAGDIQVVARAGSGKTRTLVSRAIFLQKHCRVSPHELLLLAFNKAAAEDMKSKITRAIGVDLPHVMTFHALAHAIVHPEEDLVYDDVSEDNFGLSRKIQEIIDEHVQSKEFGNHIRDLMLARFREDWERIVDGRFQLTMDEFLAHRRSLPRESLKGDYVKSFGEKIIANALFEHGVEYRYERNFRWGGINYRPDFTIFNGHKGGVIIEYFGLKNDDDYDEMSQMKREFWRNHAEWVFLEFTPSDIVQNGVDAFIDALLVELRKASVSCERRSEEEIWELVRRRALDKFTSAMTNFVSRSRKGNMRPEDLEGMIDTHIPCSTAESLFLEVGISIYREYLQRLAERNLEDFDGLMWRSASLVREGQTRFIRNKGREQGDVTRMKFVMIDEFQDFSAVFFELAYAIRSVNQRANFFCVGDDWQAINGFAGADLRYYRDFNKYFRDISQRLIRTNYRSPMSIVAVSNALMNGRGQEAVPDRVEDGQVWLCKMNNFNPSIVEKTRHDGDEITPAVLRLVRNFLDRGLDVVILSRGNWVPWYVKYDGAIGKPPNALVRFREHICSFLPDEDRKRIQVKTTHKFKGLQKPAVILIDAKVRSYPLIHPNWVFLRVFGDNIEGIKDEERRLFYVALTRAMDSLALVTESSMESPYLNDIRRHANLGELTWSDLPPMPSLDGSRLEIRVFNAYDVKDHLKDLEYRWNREGKYWQRAVLEENFSFEALLGQSWVRKRVKVEVWSETGEMLHQT